MKVVYNILMVLAGFAFILGVFIKIFSPAWAIPEWLAPSALWRASIWGIGFSLVFLLMEIRDLMLAKK